MTRKERMAMEIGLAFDFLRFVVDNPAELKRIPNGASIEVVTSVRALPPRPEGMPTVTYLVDRQFRAVTASV